MQKEESKNFDDIFKNKLQGLSSDSNPSDWIMMERLLEMEGLTQENEATDETRFDEVALDKLNNIPTVEFTPDWDRMSDMIDQMNEEPSMEPSEFDQSIDNKIKTTTVPLDMATWDRMEPVLDRDRAAILQDLDEVAKGKLTSISEVEPAWGSMNSKINRELFLPESIVKYKVIEVALILLFAFSVAQFPIKEISEHVANNKTQSIIVDPVPQITQTATITEKNNEPAITQINEAPRVDAVVPNEVNILIAEQVSPGEPTTTDNSLTTAIKTETAVVLSESIDLANDAIWALPPTIVDAFDKFSDQPSFKFTADAYKYLFQPADISGYDRSMAFLALYDQQLVENVFGTSNPVNNKTDKNKKLDVALLDRTETPTLSQTLSPSPIIGVSATDPYLGNSGLILSVFTGSDYNEIVTPFDPVYAKEGTQQWNVGYAGGLALGMRFKNWELETGAIYASNQYSPRKLYEINSGNISTGYIASTLRDIELDIVKIPLNFRFNVNLWDKWKVYALSGATMNMVIQSEFVTTETFYGKGSFTSPANPVAPGNIASNSGLARKDFSEGILEGGSFKDNSFFTANLGLGVERTLNSKWSVFAQPTYQRQIFSNGIGPNQDRYNAISLFLGTRVALSNKVKK